MTRFCQCVLVGYYRRKRSPQSQLTGCLFCQSGVIYLSENPLFASLREMTVSDSTGGDSHLSRTWTAESGLRREIQ